MHALHCCRCRSWLGLSTPVTPRDWAAAGVEHLRVDVPDFTQPSIAQVKQCCRFLDEHLARGTVYVHCKAGRGRSACVVACYLVHRQRLSAADAMEYVRRRRPHVSLGDSQQERIQRFAAHIHA